MSFGLSKYLFVHSCNTVVGEVGGGREINESQLVHILHDDFKICVNSQIQGSPELLKKSNTSIKEFYLDLMHREFLLTFNKNPFRET